MTDQTAVSGPERDNAGQTSTDLSSIIGAAMDDAGITGSVFAEAPADKAAPSADAKPQKDTSATPAAETAAAGETTDGKPSPEKTPKVAAERKTDDATGTKPPDHWDAQTRDAFGKLTEEGKQLFLKIEKGREAHYTRRNQELAADRKFASEVRSILTDDHRKQLQAAGMTEAQGIQRLVEYQDAYLKSPEGYVRWLVERSNLDPKQVFPELAGGQPAPSGQPQATQPVAQPAPQAHPQFNQLLEQVQTLSGWVMQTEEQRASSEVQRFRDAKDADGNPLHPHLDAVEQEMARLLSEDSKIVAIQSPADRLQRAYEVAVYADPALRTKIIDAEAQKRTAAQRRDADLKKAQNARSPVASPAQASPTSLTKTSLEDDITEAMRKAGL